MIPTHMADRYTRCGEFSWFSLCEGRLDFSTDKPEVMLPSCWNVSTQPDTWLFGSPYQENRQRERGGEEALHVDTNVNTKQTNKRITEIAPFEGGCRTF